jgi:hypothetical protein
MRYATVTLQCEAGDVHPIDAVFARADDVSVEAIRYVSPGPEGRYVELLELSGDLDRARALLAASPAALEYDVAGTGGHGVAYVQCRTAGLVDELLAALHDNEIVVDWPMYYRSEAGEDGDGLRGLTVTVVGTNRAIQRAAAALPPEIRLSLERTGEYEPETGRLSGLLTERQLEVFDLAVREGYYEVPRRTTQRALADAFDLATGTVSEHLQRIEAKLIGAYVDPP